MRPKSIPNNVICRLNAVWLIMGSVVVGSGMHDTPTASAQQQARLQTGMYEEFNTQCIAHFGAEKEEEVYRRCGQDLKMTAGSGWRYVSERSAVIAWETNLPASSVVEFGETNQYGQKTVSAERRFYLHVHYIRGLKPGTTYHYRLGAIDERQQTLLSRDLTFSTQVMSEAVKIPGDISGPPYVLDRANTTYLVTEDITADSTALNIAADGVILDLGGHAVVYNETADSADDSANERLYGWHATQGPCGLRTADGRKSIKIVNGILKQGRGIGASRPAAYNPIFMRRPRNSELAGVTVEYAGRQVTGIVIDSAYEGVHVHHNVLVDRGTELDNRHRGLDGIRFGVEGGIDSISQCHHNLIKRTRHRGLTVSSNTDIYANEIYVDSYATNSYGIMYYSSRDPIHDVSIHDNHIFGTGYHPIGIGAGFHAKGIRVYGNFIQMQGMEREERWSGGAGGGDPAGQLHPVNGVRLHKGPQEDVEYRDNTIVVKGRGDNCMMRGVWLVPMGEMRNVVLRDNVVKVIAEDQRAEGHAVAALGTDSADPAENITLIGNTIVSNLCNVRLGDNYGHGGRYQFVSNVFARVGSDPRYKTIRLGWDGWKNETFGHVFVDTTFEGGAGYESVSFDGAQRARYDFAVGWRLDVNAAAGAKVAIEDSKGDQVYSGYVPAAGLISVPLIQYVQKREGRIAHTPHSVTVQKEGKSKTTVVSMDKARRIEIGM